MKSCASRFIKFFRICSNEKFDIKLASVGIQYTIISGLWTFLKGIRNIKDFDCKSSSVSKIIKQDQCGLI